MRFSVIRAVMLGSVLALAANCAPTQLDLKKLHQQAEAGDAFAQNNLAVEYWYDGTSDTEAFQWMRMSADRGLPLAAYNLALLYFYGYGVSQDDSEMARWMQKSADMRTEIAENNLGVLYADGDGVPKDMRKAKVLFRRAADQHNVVGAYNLGMLYAEEGDVKWAKTWLERAARGGLLEAQGALEQLQQEGKIGQSVSYMFLSCELGRERDSISLCYAYREPPGEPDPDRW